MSSAKAQKSVEAAKAFGELSMTAIRATMHNESLLDLALTHASHESATAPHLSYERLEFLGDSMLGATIVEAIYHRFPESPEGPLSRLKSQLVSAESLSQISEDLGWIESVRVGNMDAAQFSSARKNLAADVVEAVIGAVYLDQGFDAARALVLRLFEQRLASATLQTARQKDAKSVLHELVQGAVHDRPVYEVLEAKGPAHAREFLVEVRILNQPAGRAWGKSHKIAEQSAAELALVAIQQGKIVLEKDSNT